MKSKEALNNLYEFALSSEPMEIIIKDFKDIIEKDLDVLQQYKKIEKELGIDLITLLTALTKGYVFWKYDNFIYKVEVEGITNCCLKVNTWYYANFNKNGKRYGDDFSINTKDYGETWALTKEELENGFKI